MSSGKIIRFCIFIFASYWASAAFAADSALVDTNGDGVVKILAFGDSITYGIGDGGLGTVLGPRGYPKRLANLTGVLVTNDGVPGEVLTTNGVDRFVSSVRSAKPDVVVLMEGANDAYNHVDYATFNDAEQRLINAASVLGVKIFIVTLPTPCCDHFAESLATSRYSDLTRVLSGVNEIQYIDLEKAWASTCVNKSACELYNLPEGLHPTAKGYDVIAQTIAAGLLGIDILSAGGAAELEAKLGLTAGTVIVKPVVTPTAG